MGCLPTAEFHDSPKAHMIGRYTTGLYATF